MLRFATFRRFKICSTDAIVRNVKYVQVSCIQHRATATIRRVLGVTIFAPLKIGETARLRFAISHAVIWRCDAIFRIGLAEKLYVLGPRQKTLKTLKTLGTSSRDLIRCFRKS